MSLNDLMNVMLPAIERELHRQIATLDQPRLRPFFEMLAYHMGWTSENSAPGRSGKRLRPILLLLVMSSCDRDWLRAIPAASAVELIHNFSLVHDDVQDNSPMRHGRPSIWVKYGIPMAINIGDALFALANKAILDLSKLNSSVAVIRSSVVLHNSCVQLTCGQFLDMSNEKKKDMDINDYWPMIEGKTAALLSACTQIGAILGEANDFNCEQYRIFGRDLGLAFQVQDDIIGVWGKESLTGKSNQSDLLEGKNSLPILFGIKQGGKFAKLWQGSGIHPDNVVQAAQLLKDEGAYEFSKKEASRLTTQAMDALHNADPQGDAGIALVELADKLLVRES
jgi:geranylgeranyl diphosphate synthase type I